MMKKYLAVLLTIALVVLTACGSSNSAPQAGDEVFLPAWIADFFTEEELGSGEMLTLQTSSDYSSYATLAELLESAVTDVIKAEVLDERFDWIDYTLPHPEEFWGDGIPEEHEPRYHPFTVYRLQVLDVFYGNTEIGEVVELAQIGGVMDNFSAVNSNMLPLAIGDIFVFLLTNPNLDPAREAFPIVPMILVNPWQTVYHTSDGERTHELLESVASNNFVALAVTMDDLVDLADFPNKSATQTEGDIMDVNSEASD